MKKKNRMGKLISFLFIFLAGGAIAVPATTWLHGWFASRFMVFPPLPNYAESWQAIWQSRDYLMLFGTLLLLILMVDFMVIFFGKRNAPQIGTVKITDAIMIPAEAGEGQHGSARFMAKNEMKKSFRVVAIDRNHQLVKDLSRRGKEDLKSVSRKADVENDEQLQRENNVIDLEEWLRRQQEGVEDYALKAKTTAAWSARSGAEQYDFDRRVEGFKSAADDFFAAVDDDAETRRAFLEKFYADIGGEAIDMVAIDGQKQLIIDLTATAYDEAISGGKTVAVTEKEKQLTDMAKYDDPDYLCGVFEGVVERLGLDVAEWLEKLFQPEPETEVEEDVEEPMPQEQPEDPLFPGGGVILGTRIGKRREEYFLCSEDAHSVFLGTTGIGKSRRVVLPSIGVTAMAGESMVLTDMKGELTKYTAPFLRRLGYDVIVLDYEQPKKSMRYNLLQPVIDALKRNEIDEAEKEVWSIVTTLSPENNYGEKIWTHGEQSVLAACIMAVVYDNRDRPQYQNLANVYAFLAEMVKMYDVVIGKRVTKMCGLNGYIQSISDDHPVKRLFAIAEISPENTRGSFYSGALTTLRLFTGRYIQEITGSSDFEPGKIGRQKTALFIILPDQEATYYSVATLVVSQLYRLLVYEAKKHGDVLPVPVNFFLDEFGNFTKIDNLDQMFAVARSRGIRLNIFLQAFAQLEKQYGKETTATVLNQCTNWVYMAANDIDTPTKFSDRLGSYTTLAHGMSSSHSTAMRSTQGSEGRSYNMVGRKLLFADEIQKIRSPWMLVLSGGKAPLMATCPDISQTCWNAMFGMGSKAENDDLRRRREAARTERELEGGVEIDHSWRKFIPGYDEENAS